MKSEFHYGSESFRKLNPHLFMGGLATAKREPNPQPALDKNAQAQSGRQRSMAILVTIIACRNQLCDDDNSGMGGSKALRDAIAQTFGIDDADKRIRFQYGQCETRGTPGTIVLIERKLL